MAVSQTTVLERIRDLVAELDGMQAVYSPSESDGNGIPEALNEFPCALVLPGPTEGEYILGAGQHRHTYEVRVQVLQDGGDAASKAANLLPYVDRFIEKFTGNVTLGARANSCVFTRSSGFVGLEYGGVTYMGYELFLRVSEQAVATPAPGA